MKCGSGGAAEGNSVDYPTYEYQGNTHRNDIAGLMPVARARGWSWG